MDNVKAYLNETSELLADAPLADIRRSGNLLVEAYNDGRQVFMMGNGGSAATASHLVADLQKNIGLDREKKFKVISLTDNIPLISAWSNDFDYSDIFVEQLAPWLNAGDLVIAISGSGNSQNVLKAVEFANEHGGYTIGICGFDGGKLAKIAQHSIIFGSKDMQHIEDAHMVVGHLLFRFMTDNIGK